MRGQEFTTVAHDEIAEWPGVTRGGLTFDEVVLQSVRARGWGVETLRLLKLPLLATDPMGRLVDEACGIPQTVARHLAAACFVTVWTRLPLLEGEDTTVHDAMLLEKLQREVPEFPWEASL